MSRKFSGSGPNKDDASAGGSSSISFASRYGQAQDDDVESNSRLGSTSSTSASIGTVGSFAKLTPAQGPRGRESSQGKVPTIPEAGQSSLLGSLFARRTLGDEDEGTEQPTTAPRSRDGHGVGAVAVQGRPPGRRFRPPSSRRNPSVALSVPVAAEVAEDSTELRQTVRDLQDQLAQERADRVYGEVIDSEEIIEDSDKCCSPSSRTVRLAIAAVVVVVVAVVVTVLVLTLGEDSGDSTDPASTTQTGPSEAPPTTTPSPTTSPATSPPSATPLDLEALIASLSPDKGKALTDPSSPQSKALNWLMGNAYLDLYSQLRLIQRYVLVVVYYTTNGDNWTNKAGWLSDDNECHWFTSTSKQWGPCDNETLIAIDLEDNGLEGTIPKELTMLAASLDELRFYINNMFGTIPTELGLMTVLASLKLDRNNLTGTLPTEIGRMRNLRFVDIDENSINGTIPTEIGWTNLVELDLDENELTGTIPTELGQVTELTDLNLRENNLNGTIPSELLNLEKLNSLHLDGNELTGSFECPDSIQLCAISCEVKDDEVEDKKECREL